MEFYYSASFICIIIYSFSYFSSFFIYSLFSITKINLLQRFIYYKDTLLQRLIYKKFVKKTIKIWILLLTTYSDVINHSLMKKKIFWRDFLNIHHCDLTQKAIISLIYILFVSLFSPSHFLSLLKVVLKDIKLLR